MKKAQLCLPRNVDRFVCNMCGTALGEAIILTRDTNGKQWRFGEEDCYCLWAKHNLTQFCRRTA